MQSEEATERTWDRGISYEQLKTRIIEALPEYLSKKETNSLKKVAYLTIYGIQLRNGCRISEATEGFIKFAGSDYKKDGQGKYTLALVRKKRKKTKKGNIIPPEYRRIRFPNFLPYDFFELVKKDSKFKGLCLIVKKKNAQDMCDRLIDSNTHTMRYARITALSEQGVAPQLVAKIVHHKKLDQMLTYQQRRLANKIDSEFE